jgi:hypothetical protein
MLFIIGHSWHGRPGRKLGNGIFFWAWLSAWCFVAKYFIQWMLEK